VVVAFAGCAVPNQSEPHNVPANQRFDLSGGPGNAVGGGGADAPRVYFLSVSKDGVEKLQPAARPVPAIPSDVLRALLAGLSPVELSRGWRTWVPSDTQVRGTLLGSDGILTVDLTKAFYQATGEFQQKAVAQIVFTAMGLDEVKGVLITIEGQEPTDGWPIGDGTLKREALTRYDYPALDPSQFPNVPAQASPSAGTTTTTMTAPPTTTTTHPATTVPPSTEPTHEPPRTTTTAHR
jgi:hypothetical protein